jgi:hypothetical protein
MLSYRDMPDRTFYFDTELYRDQARENFGKRLHVKRKELGELVDEHRKLFGPILDGLPPKSIHKSPWVSVHYAPDGNECAVYLKLQSKEENFNKVKKYVEEKLRDQWDSQFELLNEGAPLKYYSEAIDTVQFTDRTKKLLRYEYIEWMKASTYVLTFRNLLDGCTLEFNTPRQARLWTYDFNLHTADKLFSRGKWVDPEEQAAKLLQEEMLRLAGEIERRMVELPNEINPTWWFSHAFLLSRSRQWKNKRHPLAHLPTPCGNQNRQSLPHSPRP